jgi:hypothetical protein
MFDEAARQFLDKRLLARLSTIGSDGYPHVVPIWYMRDGDDLVFISDRTAHKTQNALANPKGAATIGGDMDDDAGYMIRGDLVVETDTNQAITWRVIDRYEDKASGDKLKEEWKNDDIVVIRLKPRKVVRVR